MSRWAEIATYLDSPTRDGYEIEHIPFETHGGSVVSGSSYVSRDGMDAMIRHARIEDAYQEALDLLLPGNGEEPLRCREHGSPLRVWCGGWELNDYARREESVTVFEDHPWFVWMAECVAKGNVCVVIHAHGLPGGHVLTSDAPWDMLEVAP